MHDWVEASRKGDCQGVAVPKPIMCICPSALLFGLRIVDPSFDHFFLLNPAVPSNFNMLMGKRKLLIFPGSCRPIRADDKGQEAA